jgi:hypothetical protein
MALRAAAAMEPYKPTESLTPTRGVKFPPLGSRIAAAKQVRKADARFQEAMDRPVECRRKHTTMPSPGSPEAPRTGAKIEPYDSEREGGTPGSGAQIRPHDAKDEGCKGTPGTGPMIDM